MRCFRQNRTSSSGLNDYVPKRPVDWVNPLIDTGKPKVRWVFSGSVCRPFSMVRLSPDTDPAGCWGAGYRYFSDT
ncbi:MAG: hypothetical protein K9N51_13610, partial [Candidatus Pacebacteria bacterium]|nr:hypothetical protein [Candidatus Paceibacterota bacterium]